MAIFNFIKPDKVVLIKSDKFEGHFEFRPLERGFGLTIGNALRRVLLSSLEGFAITSIKMEHVEHEFSTVKGVVEDVTEIILNLKKVRLKRQIEDFDKETVAISIKNQESVTAGDLGKFISGFQVLNPDVVICHLDKSVEINVTLTIDKGRGYVPAEENKKGNAPIGTIAIDAIYTPIKNVKYTIENYRVEQKTDYEKLIFHVQTDGSISPKNALIDAARILIDHFTLFSEDTVSSEVEEVKINEPYDEEILRMRQLLKTRLVDMDLSVRVINCLKAAELETLGELVKFTESDLMKFRNFGKKSLSELKVLVKQKQLTFGMDLSKYKLEE